MIEQVRTQASSPTVIVPGMLIPRDRVEVKVPYPAKIAEVFVNKGDIVKEGHAMARLAGEEVELKLNQLKAAKKEAEGTLENNSYLLKNRDKLLEEGKIDKTQYDGIEIENAHAENVLNRVKADMASAEYNAAHLQITSPIDGVVTERYAAPMQMAGENQILFTIVNTDPILVSFQLTADESSGVRTGMPINIKVEDLGGEEYNGSVSYISPELHQAGRTFDVRAGIANPDGVLKAGMQATTLFTSTNVHKVIVVPDSAIVTRDRDRYVFTVTGGKARLAKVRVRNIHDGIAEISDGLSENDFVVAKGAAGLQDGQPLEMWRR
jgi:RND family efflux transporter MFP subunit